MNGLPDRTSGERPRASSIVRVRRLDPMKLGPFAGEIRTKSCRGPNLFCRSTGRYIGAAALALATVVGAASIHPGSGNPLSFAGGAKSRGPSMSIKFEGKPPFYLGIAEVASAHALDGSIVLRATISVPELRPKSVSVQFLVATDVAKALAEQLPIAVRMAELQKQQGG